MPETRSTSLAVFLAGRVEATLQTPCTLAFQPPQLFVQQFVVAGPALQPRCVWYEAYTNSKTGNLLCSNTRGSLKFWQVTSVVKVGSKFLALSVGFTFQLLTGVSKPGGPQLRKVPSLVEPSATRGFVVPEVNSVCSVHPQARIVVLPCKEIQRACLPHKYFLARPLGPRYSPRGRRRLLRPPPTLP